MDIGTCSLCDQTIDMKYLKWMRNLQHPVTSMMSMLELSQRNIRCIVQKSSGPCISYLTKYTTRHFPWNIDEIVECISQNCEIANRSKPIGDPVQEAGASTNPASMQW